MSDCITLAHGSGGRAYRELFRFIRQAQRGTEERDG